MFYSEQQAREVGHPWQSDASWGAPGAENQLVQDVGLFLFCVLIGTVVVVLGTIVTIATVPVYVYRKLRGML